LNLPAVMDMVVPFVLLLGVLIFIHELGHFAVAKWLGVKVEKFSIGFGPSLLARKVGETEYVIAALPLGGFVKMLGEVPGEEMAPDEVSRAFNARPVWQRIAIAIAGPVMNLALPVFLIAAILMAGMPTPTSLVAGVDPGSRAEKAGITDGDRIVAVGGESIWRWSELQEKFASSAAAALPLTVEKPNGKQVQVTLEREKNDKGVWKDPGLSWHAPAALIGVADAQSPAAIAGLQTGDLIVAVNGAPVASLFALKRELAGAKAPIELEVERPLDGQTEKARVTVRALPGEPTLDALGIVPIGVSFESVFASSPAKQAGVQPNDVVLRIDGALVQSGDQMRNVIFASEGKPLTLALLRDKRFVEAQVSPVLGPIQMESGATEEHYTIGVKLDAVAVGGELKDDMVRNPLVAVGRGATRTVELFGMIVGGIAQLVTGSVGMNSLSGPIGIAGIASEAYKSSWTQFVWLMAVISVNLAILNLLPIPVLDGGQIALAAAEGIKGSPLPARARDIAQTIGLSLILLLMGVAFWNDIARNWAGMMSFFQNLG
jgi:regulator of sigma E protease